MHKILKAETGDISITNNIVCLKWCQKLQEPGNKQNEIKENEQNCQIMYTSNQ